MATKGHLVFHSETGTEGGWYAWQDDAFTHWRLPCPWGSPGCPVARGVSNIHKEYEGLHRLQNGDHLRVFDRGQVRWEGVVQLRLRDDVYVNPDAEVFGLWVNQEPDVGVDRMTWAKWFIDELACEVTPA